MSNTNDQRKEIAEAFDREIDPLAEYTSTFEEMDVDLYDLFESEVLESRDLSASSHRQYERIWRQYSEFMREHGRHPACPSEENVKTWLRREVQELGYTPAVVKEKCRKINSMYQYWQSDPSFPHPQDYNPFDLARQKVNFGEQETKEPPRMSLSELRENIERITNVRDKAVVVPQFKLGLRAGELCNIKLSEIDIDSTELQDHYPELGSHPMLEGREDAIYIPHDREGNKSQRPRVFPLDEEVRHVLLQYLLIRPDNGEPWLILTQSNHSQMDPEDVNEVWRSYFRPEYNETEQHRAVTSHYGRHRFTTYWRVEQDVNRELIKYMRGDNAGGRKLEDRNGIDTYIHTYYEDIEELYREEIFKLGL